jgi:hypothetical protein
VPDQEVIYKKASEVIKKSHQLTAFTGAGISVESGIPPFRGENGLLTISGADAFDGIPVLDIKPYFDCGDDETANYNCLLFCIIPIPAPINQISGGMLATMVGPQPSAL